VEAFPNAFLGVLMPEEELALAPKFNRGRRLDWLYETGGDDRKTGITAIKRLRSTGDGLAAFRF
jgi:hypothetical protein